MYAYMSGTFRNEFYHNEAAEDDCITFSSIKKQYAYFETRPVSIVMLLVLGAVCKTLWFWSLRVHTWLRHRNMQEKVQEARGRTQRLVRAGLRWTSEAAACGAAAVARTVARTRRGGGGGGGGGGDQGDYYYQPEEFSELDDGYSCTYQRTPYTAAAGAAATAFSRTHNSPFHSAERGLGGGMEGFQEGNNGVSMEDEALAELECTSAFRVSSFKA
jgi:hypothetical protein